MTSTATKKTHERGVVYGIVHIDARTAAARILGIEVIHCDTPDAAARTLAGNAPHTIPEAALLGLDDSPVL